MTTVANPAGVNEDFNPSTVNEGFNLSTAQSSSGDGLAQAIWLNLKRGSPLTLVHDAPFNKASSGACRMLTRRVTFSGSRPPHSMTCLTRLSLWIDQAVAHGLV